MKHPLAVALAVALTAAVSAQTSAQNTPQQATPVNASSNAQSANPLLAQSPLPLRYPQFDRLQDAHFAPAFDAGMAKELEEIAAIANQRSAPTFENTIIALEKSGKQLYNARRIFSNLNGTDTNDTRKQINNEYAPKFAAHRDEIMLNPQLFARVKAVYDQRNGCCELRSPARRHWRVRAHGRWHCAEWGAEWGAKWGAEWGAEWRSRVPWTRNPTQRISTSRGPEWHSVQWHSAQQHSNDGYRKHSDDRHPNCRRYPDLWNGDDR